MNFEVIVCGSLHLDIVVNAPALPRIDETAVGHAWQQVCGGKGGNQAVQAARAGAKTAMIGRIGQDAFGATLSQNLKSAGVDLTCLTTDPTQGSGMSVAILQDNGDYGAVIVSGSNLTIDPTEMSADWKKLGGARVLVLQNEIPDPVNAAIAQVATKSGAIVVLNAAPAREMSDHLLENVSVLIVNRVEAEAMSGQAVHDFASARRALPKLLGPRRSVVITLGGEGLLVAPCGETPTEISALKVKVTSTHGAGDCFVGSLAAQLAKGVGLIEASQTANQRAAAFVSRT